LDIAVDCRAEHIERPNNIGFEGPHRVAGATQYRRLRGEVVDEIGPGASRGYRARIANVCLDQAESRLIVQVCEIRSSTAREIVQRDNFHGRVLQKSIDEVAANKAGPASDHDPSAVLRHFSNIASAPCFARLA
jgi:hypothetical protein